MKEEIKDNRHNHYVDSVAYFMKSMGAKSWLERQPLWYRLWYRFKKFIHQLIKQS